MRVVKLRVKRKGVFELRYRLIIASRVEENSLDEEMFPTLTTAQLSRIAAHGHVRHIEQGEVLVDAGEPVTRLFVVTAGQIEVVRAPEVNEETVAVFRPGMFTGEVAILTPEDLAAAHWPLTRAPHLLETSLPGVFAVGDVRQGSLKRVASAVGEGSIAVAFVHQVLHE